MRTSMSTRLWRSITNWRPRVVTSRYSFSLLAAVCWRLVRERSSGVRKICISLRIVPASYTISKGLENSLSLWS